MVLDLFTLYAVILLKSAALTVLWLGFWLHHRSHSEAWIWALSNAALMFGGLVMSIESRAGPLAPVIAGNVILIFGFFAWWAGLCRFVGREPSWLTAILASAFALCMLVVFQDSRLARNGVYMVGQGLPMALCAALLVAHRRGGGATWPTALLMGLSVLNVVARYFGVVLNDIGLLSTDHYNGVLFITMLASITLGMTANFGFLLLVVERLHTETAALAGTDELTGLPNRRALVSRLEGVVRGRKELAGPFGLLMIDLDRFKVINDEYGHAAGDACLLHFSRLARGRLRRDDLLARMGGDEFCLLLPGADLAEAGRVAGSLVQMVRDHPLVLDGLSIPLTLSIGAAAAPNNQAFEPTRLLAEADRALYLAKRRGRDGHALAETSSAPAPEAQPGAMAAARA